MKRKVFEIALAETYRGTGGTILPKFEVGNGPCIRSPVFQYFEK